jgi:5'-3' exonuclease
MSRNFVLIDASYFIFYRYYALLQWWNISKQEPPLDDPSENERFVDLYRSTFVKKIKEISKKLKLVDPVYIVGKDCPREKIWRNKYIDEYKGERKKDNYVGFFFNITYEENLFEKAGITSILSHPNLEADDCIAIACRYISNDYNLSNSNIYIIANDMDYMQICNDKINLYNLKYKHVSSSIRSKEDARKYLFCKILMGDKSDNIPSVFPKCGQKSAIKYYEDQKYFEDKINTNKKYVDMYNRNQLIIDFAQIPSCFVLDMNIELEKIIL